MTHVYDVTRTWRRRSPRENDQTMNQAGPAFVDVNAERHALIFCMSFDRSMYVHIKLAIVYSRAFPG